MSLALHLCFHLTAELSMHPRNSSARRCWCAETTVSPVIPFAASSRRSTLIRAAVVQIDLTAHEQVGLWAGAAAGAVRGAPADTGWHRRMRGLAPDVSSGHYCP